MRTLRFFIFLTIVAGILAGCSTHSYLKTDPVLAKATYDDRTLTIYPTSSHRIQVDNPKDVADDFKQETREHAIVLADSFRVWSHESATKAIANITLIDIRNSPTYDYMDQPEKFFSVELQVDNDGKGEEETVARVFYIPRDSTLIEAGIEPDVVLYFDSLRVDKVTNWSAGVMFSPMGPMPSASSETFLIGDTSYVLWDYQADRAIAWGKFTDKVSVFLACTQTTWKSLVRSIIDLSVMKTNLKAYPY